MALKPTLVLSCILLVSCAAPHLVQFSSLELYWLSSCFLFPLLSFCSLLFVFILLHLTQVPCAIFAIFVSIVPSSFALKSLYVLRLGIAANFLFQNCFGYVLPFLFVHLAVGRNRWLMSCDAQLRKPPQFASCLHREPSCLVL